MATESNVLSSCIIDASFDMDEALTLHPNFGHQIAVSDSLVANLPIVSGDGGICSVCMEGFQLGIGGKRVPCGHVHHAACLSSWFSNNNSCPLCRFNISIAK
ncbi:E3 ubiquitin-protein ligase RING1-like [Manihot esculenta]|nr:E3 ubiquitin-protein ligase RING1-like [Manihot esculenta]